MIKNIHQKNTKSNDSNILLIVIVSVILIISMFAGLFLFSEKPDSNIIKEKNTNLYPINNSNIESLGDGVYRGGNNNFFVYCPFKEGKDDDKDGVLNACDNCPIHYNPDQLDNDRDGIGNVCDPDPNHAENKGGGNGDIIRCHNDSECNDGNSNTRDICHNAGTLQSFCTNEPINQNIICVSDTNCGNNGFIEQPFCSSNNINQLFRTWHCMNPNSPQSFCTSNNEQRTIQTCSFGCSNGQCAQPPQCTPSTEICDGIDNDCDSQIDEGNVCAPPVTPQCDDGIDNDGDHLIDYPADPGCTSRLDNDEYNAPAPSAPQCDDGIDNDHDGLIDFPVDPGCSNRLDNSE